MKAELSEAAGRFVIRYDSRDAGRSTGTAVAPGYTLRDLAADAVGVLDRFGAARGHLVGMSGGAAAAQLVVLDHPSRVASITLTCSTPGIPGVETRDPPPPTVRFPAASAVDWSDRDEVVAYLVEAERPYAGQFDELSARALMERVVDRAIDIRASANKPFEVDPGAPWRGRLGEIAVPTLLVHGWQDPMFRRRTGVRWPPRFQTPSCRSLTEWAMSTSRPPPGTLSPGRSFDAPRSRRSSAAVRRGMAGWARPSVELAAVDDSREAVRDADCPRRDRDRAADGHQAALANLSAVVWRAHNAGARRAHTSQDPTDYRCQPCSRMGARLDIGNRRRRRSRQRRSSLTRRGCRTSVSCRDNGG